MGFHKSEMCLDLEHLLLLPPGDGGMRKDLEGLILPFFPTSSSSNTALFGKQGEVGQFCTLFPKLHFFFFLAHKSVHLLSLNTEVTPTP